jgi:hypothetical protein
MVYWSTVILTLDKDGYYNIHHRTYLWYTGLPLYLHLTKMATIAFIIELIYDILVYRYTYLTKMIITDIIELIYGILVYRYPYT